MGMWGIGEYWGVLGSIGEYWGVLGKRLGTKEQKEQMEQKELTTYTVRVCPSLQQRGSNPNRETPSWRGRGPSLGRERKEPPSVGSHRLVECPDIHFSVLCRCGACEAQKVAAPPACVRQRARLCEHGCVV